jgi:hypothetical protein
MPLPSDIGGSELLITASLDAGSVRTYGSGSGAMTAAVYDMVSGPVTASFGVVVNQYTCNQKEELRAVLLTMFAKAIAARNIATYFFGYSSPHKGYIWPYTEIMRLENDADHRPRGFCGIARLLGETAIPTTDLVVPIYFGEAPPPE